MCSFIVDLLFPKHCLNCGSLGSFICISCQKSLRFVEKQLCFYCKKPSLHGLTHPACQKRNGIDGCVTVFRYDPVLKNIIKAIKYRLVGRAIPELMLVATPHIADEVVRLKSLYQCVLQPIPLHSSRLKERGFNQSYYIASYISASFNLGLCDMIKRVKKTQAQARLLSSKERRENILNAFILQKKILPETIILVDDVITSGATIAQVATLLKRSGVKRVFAFSLAI